MIDITGRFHFRYQAGMWRGRVNGCRVSASTLAELSEVVEMIMRAKAAR